MSHMVYRHPKSDELDNLYAMKRQLEQMVQTAINDAARDAIGETLNQVKHQIFIIKNGL